MSYLPRMSKTYKEPKELPQEEPEPNDGSNPVQPASSLLNEKTHNPQIALKHYKYLPHPLPTLPGPSVAQEATENELYREASRHRRSSIKSDDIKPSMITFAIENQKPSCHKIKEIQSGEEINQIPKPSSSKRIVKGSKTHVNRKKSSKTLVKKKESTTKVKDVTINMCLVGTNITKSLVAAQTERNDFNLKENDQLEFLNRNELNSLKRENSVFLRQNLNATVESSNQSHNDKEFFPQDKRPEEKEKETTHRSVQCTIFGSAEKVFVIPLIINSLLKALAFLLHEVNREEAVSCSTGEKKRLMNQIQLILGDLCNQKCGNEFGFNTTYSDSKRMEKIFEDLQKYVKDTYGDKVVQSNEVDKMKKVFVDLKKKEMELNFLNEKLSEKETLQINDVEVKENDYKNPEITLQNKRLESEQLIAQIEFSFMELKKYEKALAEVEWDIKTSQEQVNSLKKSLIIKSKTNMVGKKTSQKFSSEILEDPSKSKETKGITFKQKI